MKFSRIIALLLVLSMTLPFICACGDGEDGEPKKNYPTKTLNVYNWGEYISDEYDEEAGLVDVNAEFEDYFNEKLADKYGCYIKVNYSTYATNEDMYAKIRSGATSYDVIIPSDYMIGRLEKEGYLAELDFNNIPNYKYIDEKYLNTSYDPENKYSVPYNVGLVGVIYNTTMVEGTPTSWSLMWDERYKGKILNFNNLRDAFAIAQFYEGVDINTTDKDELDKVFDKLVEQKQILQYPPYL